jgi:hypothetical protein
MVTMADSVPNLKLLDRSALTDELDLASELFHRINRIIPENQELLVVPRIAWCATPSTSLG